MNKLHLGASLFIIGLAATFMAVFIASIRETAPDFARMTDHHFSFLHNRLKTNAVMEEVA